MYALSWWVIWAVWIRNTGEMSPQSDNSRLSPGTLSSGTATAPVGDCGTCYFSLQMLNPSLEDCQEDKPGLPTVPQTVNSRIITWLSSLSSFNHNWARPSKGTGMRLIPTEPINFFYRNSPCLTSGISAALHCFGSIAFMLLAVLRVDYPSSQ